MSIERTVRKGYPPEGHPVDNRVFRLLRSIPLDRTVYPFKLKGEEYLNSHWKRALDLAVGGPAAFSTLIPVGIFSLLMKIESPDLSPIITQDRFGKDNKKFPMFKIRSQTVDTEGSGTINPTRMGNILRRYSLDELPQFWNVLRGEMSLVGRRPTLPYDYKQFEDSLVGNSETCGEMVQRPGTWEVYQRNDLAKPGMTGLQQIMGRRSLNPVTRARLENFYERNASLGLDLAILAVTLPTAISPHGVK